MRRISVVGLGYVGLPLAVAFSRRFPGTIGFDIDSERVRQLRSGKDRTRTVEAGELAASGLRVTDDPEELRAADFHVVAVPTPIDSFRRPDLTALCGAARTVGAALATGDIVVVESTVYPGVTDEVVAPILAQVSGLTRGRDFTLGYSPERINPGDKEHTLERVTKVVSGEDERTLRIVSECYRSVAPSVHEAPSIQVAEAAKVIENVQRDLNIALMNELAIIFDRIGLDSRAVFAASATKWNFHRYHPGLVGGHCIGVDPYYLTCKAESVGIHPQVILAGRRVNDDMGRFVAGKTVKLLIQHRRAVDGARVAILGVTFKRDVPDVRNSRVPEIARELSDFGIETLVHDPLADAAEVQQEYGLELVPEAALQRLDAVLLTTPHKELCLLAPRLCGAGRAPLLLDVLAALSPREIPEGVHTWHL